MLGLQGKVSGFCGTPKEGGQQFTTAADWSEMVGIGRSGQKQSEMVGSGRKKVEKVGKGRPSLLEGAYYISMKPSRNVVNKGCVIVIMQN